MKKQPTKPILFFLLFVSLTVGITAQTTPEEDTKLKKFQNIDKAEEKFTYFFETDNRYDDNSGYDWLETVNVYISSSRKIKDSLGIRNYDLMRSQIYYDLEEFDRSLAIANELYKEKDKLDSLKKITLFNIMDRNYGEIKIYDKQIEIREEKQQSGLTDDVVLYDIYSNLGLHREAMKNYINAEKKNITEKDMFAQAKYRNDIGNYLRLDKSTAVALDHYVEARGFLEIYMGDVTSDKTESDVVKSKLLSGAISGNFGKCYVQLNQYEEAIPYFEEAIDIIRKNNKNTNSKDLIESTLGLAECYLQIDNLKKAKMYLDQPFSLGKVAQRMQYNTLLSIYYDKIADFRNATFYLKKNARIQDSLNDSDFRTKQQRLDVVLVQYDLENTKKRIGEQQLEIEKSKNELVENEERINLVFISLIFTLLGFAGLVYAYLKSIKNQRLIAEQKHFIEASLVEKDSLLKEIHHRVKNNLQMVSSLLSLQTKNTRSKAAIQALEEGKSRVKAMALIHQKLYQHDDLSVIEMQGYIESLINSVQSVFKKGGHNINITIDAEDVELDIDRAIPFGLILNELVSNSFKYAFPEDDTNGKIYVHLRKNKEVGYFEYTDNGIGLPEDTDERTESSMGIRLMNRLVNQLQSTLNVDKTTEGVRFWFNFK
ncbi:sensor histidine kinase [Spongiimicrobium salis]|uniref:sensor histidine kinase n=1 Tax=Spongiimicrobium salis TaxID=1667022 RepID=UPI00374CC70F